MSRGTLRARISPLSAAVPPAASVPLWLFRPTLTPLACVAPPGRQNPRPLQEVGKFIVSYTRVGQYRETFEDNFINGKRLLKLKSTQLPQVVPFSRICRWENHYHRTLSCLLYSAKSTLYSHPSVGRQACRIKCCDAWISARCSAPATMRSTCPRVTWQRRTRPKAATCPAWANCDMSCTAMSYHARAGSGGRGPSS